MRWTVCYSLMTACLSSVLWYSWQSANQPPSTILSQELDKAFALDQPAEQPVKAHPKRTTAPKKDVVETPADGLIAIGSSRDQVLATLGGPSMTNINDDRWTYGDHVIMFKDDRVTGCVKVDQAEVAKRAEASLTATLSTVNKNSTGKASTSRGCLTRATWESKASARNRIRASAGSKLAASSASRRARVSSWEPMFRPFYSNRALPRTLSPAMRSSHPMYRNFYYHQPMYQRY